MRIISFVRKNSGPCFHRLITPLLLMPDVDVFITNNLQDEHFEKGCDIFLYNRTIPEHAIPRIKELQQKYGFKICVDIDDYWELDEHHILYEEYKAVEFAKMQINHIKLADVVLTTHSRLADEIKPFNSNVHVCPNAIPKKGQFDIEREPYYLTRLFWQGSITHKEDIQILQKPINDLGKLSPKIKMVMGGYTESEDAWYEIAMIYTAGTKHQYKLIPGLPVDQYYSHYKHADICLVPLVNSRFNRMKSNLKVLEAANLGLPVIASHVHPYLGMPLYYCKCSADWVKYITRLVSRRNERKDAGLELQDYCNKHFNFDTINKERKQILEYVSKTVNV